MLDAMALLQSITQKQVPETFIELAEHIFTIVARNFTNYSRIDFVADNYPDVSIKNVERGRRSCQRGVLRVTISSGSQKSPSQWSKFLSVGSKKAQLISFFATEWSQAKFAERLAGKKLFITVGNTCIELLRSAPPLGTV